MAYRLLLISPRNCKSQQALPASHVTGILSELPLPSNAFGQISEKMKKSPFFWQNCGERNVLILVTPPPSLDEWAASGQSNDWESSPLTWSAQCAPHHVGGAVAYCYYTAIMSVLEVFLL